MKTKTSNKGALKTSHTSNSAKGMGDYYGTGVKNAVGKPRSLTGSIKSTSKKVGKAPKSLA